MTGVSFTKERLLKLYARVNEAGLPKVLTFINADLTAHDITNYVFQLKVKLRASSSNDLFTLSIGSGLTVQGVGNNELLIELSEANLTRDVDTNFWTLYSVADNNTWLNGPFFFHNGEFDGVDDTETITIDADGDAVTITVTTAGSGDVVGPAFAVSGNVPIFSGTTGKIIADSLMAFPYVTPEKYGAIGNGSTNDQAAIQLAVDSGFPVYFAQKNYRVNTGVTVPAGAKLFGSGQNSIISTAAGITILTLSGQNHIINLSFDGTDAASQVGIRVSDTTGATSTKHSNVIIGCKFTDLNYALNASQVYGANYEGAFICSDCLFQSNNIAIYLEAGSEYCEFTNCQLAGNTTGFRSDGGNNSFTGGHITGGTTGIHLTAGANNGKFLCTGTKVNHNTTALLTTGITNTSTFVNVGFFGGKLNITSSELRFIDCVFSDASPATWTLANSTAIVEFLQCLFLYTPTVSASGTTPIFWACRWISTPYFISRLNDALIVDADISPSALSGNTDNYAPSGIENAATLRISASSGYDLTGIAGGVTMVDGRELKLINVGTTNTITLKNDVTSTAANRFLANSDISLTPGTAVQLVYDATASRWRIVSIIAAGVQTTCVVTVVDPIATQNMTNQPLAEGPLNGVARVRFKFDATNYSALRLVCSVTTGSASANTPVIYPSYSTDGGSNWITIGTGATTQAISLTSVANDLFTDWITLPAGAKAYVLFRPSGAGGDATADPVVAGLHFMFRT